MKITKSLWTKLSVIGLGAVLSLGVGLSARTVSQEVQAASPQTTTISVIATKNGWVNGTKYATFTDGAFTFSGSGGTNSTKYYSSSPGTWRFYSTENPKGALTITGDATVSTISSVTSSPEATFTINGKTASITVSSNINFASFTISYTSASSGTATITNGDTLSLKTTDTGITLTGTSSGITSPSYAWSSNNTSVVTVSSGSLTSSVTIQGSGTARVTFTVSGTGGPASDYIDITVSAVVQGISVDVSSTHATTCPLWGTYSPSGLKIKVDNHMGTDPVIDTGFSVSSIDTSSLGPKTVTVTLDADNTKTTTYSVKVTNSGAVVVYNNIPLDLFISEYIEGSGTGNKAVEIYNGTGASVNLSDYTLELYSNGSASASYTVSLSGTLNNGDVFVISRTDSATGIASVTDLTSNTVINHNGDDAIVLRKGSAYIDIFGRIGEDPGSTWTSDSNSTVDKTLVRKANVTSGITVNPTSGFPTLESEWDSYAQDTFTYLGSHTMNTGSVDKSLDQATAYAAFLTTGWAATNFCAHTTTVLVEVNAEYNAMHADAKTAFNNNGAFAAARANKAYMTNYAASNPKTSAETIASSSRTTLIAATVIGILGLSTLAGFYFLKKKKESF